MKETTKKYIAFGLVMILGFGIGFSCGFYSALNFIIDKGVRFMQNQGIDFSMTANQIASFVFTYKKIIDAANGVAINLTR